MKKLIYLSFACLIIAGFSACRSRQQPDDQRANSSTTATPGPAVDYASEPVTGRLADLSLTRDSHWRGINLGDEFTTVKAKEAGAPFESDAQHVGYSVEFKNLQTADMLYYQTGGKVSAIEVDLFLNSGQSVSQNRKELEPYFTKRYGTPKPGAGGSVWTGSTGEQVSLKDVSKGKDFGLKIRIAPTDRATTASAK